MRYLYISLLVFASLPSIVKGQIITTVAGNGTAGYSGDGGQATDAELYYPSGITTDAAGNLYIADYSNNRIRMITTAGIISTLAGNGTQGYNGDGSSATDAELYHPSDIAFDDKGNLYIAEVGNNRIRQINTLGIITTVAGKDTSGFSGDGGQATAAKLQTPSGIAFDADGNIYIADAGNNRIRMINTLGIINTQVGNGAFGFNGDGGQATAAKLGYPWGVTFDAAGNLYIVDQSNNRIRKVNTAGIISTVTGTGTQGYSGDGGQATVAELNNPWEVTFDAIGNLYIADLGNNRIRTINTAGIISTIVGTGTLGYSGDGGQATAAKLNNPTGIVLDITGNLFIADEYNQRIRKVTNVAAAGIEQFANSNEQVTVYPNPASTSLTLTLSKVEGTCSVSIYDMMGKLVMQHTCFPPSEGQGEAINVADLNEGVYNISIASNGATANKRVVIVR